MDAAYLELEGSETVFCNASRTARGECVLSGKFVVLERGLKVLLFLIPRAAADRRLLCILGAECLGTRDDSLVACCRGYVPLLAGWAEIDVSGIADRFLQIREVALRTWAFAMPLRPLLACKAFGC